MMALKELSQLQLNLLGNHDDLPDTQTQSTCPTLQSQEIVIPKQAWGKLYPLVVHLKSVDLVGQSFLLGRAKDCDVSLTPYNFNPNRLKTVSKSHFIISRDEIEDCIYITDLSKNGTFVNGNQIGKGNKMILQNDDEIAIGAKGAKVYIYKPIGKSEDTYLPSELRREYEVSKKLGEGGCGEVRLLFKKESCKEFAVKRILKCKTKTDKSLNSEIRIQNEICILKALSHPNILSIVRAEETDEAVFIILEYMGGGSLDEKIRNSDKLSEQMAKFIFYQIVTGVRYLHLHGITHRDLKPENILLKTNDEQTLVKIADFGLSKVVINSTLMTTTCGTPAYLAPEVVDCRFEQYSKEVDIWSMGVLLYYMLSGELPFKSNSLHQLFKLILSATYTMDSNAWNDISEDAKNLVKHMLIVNPDNRIKISEILNHPWIDNDDSMKRMVQSAMNSHAEDPDNNVSNSDDSLPFAKRARLK